MREGWCILNGVTEKTECKTCAFRNVKCEFYCATREDGDMKLVSRSWNKNSSIDTMKNRLAEYNAIERLKRKSENKPKHQEEKTNTEEPKRKIKKDSNSDTFMYILMYTGIILLLAFPVAWLFSLCQIFTEAVCSLFSSDFNFDADPWYYSSYWARYFYCVLFGEAIIGWFAYSDESSKNEVSKWFALIAIAAYVIYSIIHFNLFISTFIGTAIIAFGLWLNILKKGPI